MRKSRATRLQAPPPDSLHIRIIKIVFVISTVLSAIGFLHWEFMVVIREFAR